MVLNRSLNTRKGSNKEQQTDIQSRAISRAQGESTCPALTGWHREGASEQKDSSQALEGPGQTSWRRTDEQAFEGWGYSRAGVGTRDPEG